MKPPGCTCYLKDIRLGHWRSIRYWHADPDCKVHV